MSYVVLARRFRPQSFDDIIGQEHISKTLKNAIAENRVAHAYLFSGPRGVGKTTTARILAKALNCKNASNANPCNDCSNCKEITGGSNVDVQEIDGASNRGIDEIRALRENVMFAPASSPYKIYIIDEAHQITDAAFNALLKTLEEPPSHVVFILATTEPQKIPITILSRCQRYRFRLLSSTEIRSLLDKIIRSEKYQIENEALQVITDAANGSLRDALSLMDQAVSFVPGKVTLADMQNLLGLLPKDIIAAATEAIFARDAKKTLALVKEITEQGYSLVQFARDLREHFRKVLLYKTSPALLEVTNEDKQALEKHAGLFSPEWIVRSSHLLSKLIDEMRWNSEPRLILELYMLRLAQPYVGVEELVQRLEKLETNCGQDDNERQVETGENSAPQKKASHALPRDMRETPVAQTKIAEKRTEEPASRESQEQDTAVLPPHAPSEKSTVQVLWNKVLADVKEQSPRLENMLAHAVIGDISGNTLLLTVTSKFQENGVKHSQPLLEGIMSKHFGKEIGLRLIVDAAAGARETADDGEILVAEESTVPPSDEVFKVEGNFDESEQSVPPEIKKITDKFPGRISRKK